MEEFMKIFREVKGIPEPDEKKPDNAEKEGGRAEMKPAESKPAAEEQPAAESKPVAEISETQEETEEN